MYGSSVLLTVLTVTYSTIEAVPIEYCDNCKNPSYDTKPFYGQLPSSSSLVPYPPRSSFSTPQPPGFPAPPSSYPPTPYAPWPVFSIDPASSAPSLSPCSSPSAQPLLPCPAPISTLPCPAPSSTLPCPAPSSPLPPPFPSPSLLRPSSQLPSFSTSTISPSVLELLLKYISTLPSQSSSLTSPGNAPRPYSASFNVPPPPFSKMIPLSFKPIQLPRPPTLCNAASSPSDWQSRSALRPLDANPSLNRGGLPPPYGNY